MPRILIVAAFVDIERALLNIGRALAVAAPQIQDIFMPPHVYKPLVKTEGDKPARGHEHLIERHIRKHQRSRR